MQCLEQFWAAWCEAFACQRVLAEQLQSPLIGEQNALLRVQHHDAGTHALEDQRVERLQVRHLFRTLARQRLADLQAASQPLNQEGGSKAERAECAGLNVLAAGFGALNAEVEGQVDQARRSNRGDEETDPATQQYVGDGNGNYQQVADTARGATAEVEQPGQQDDVHQRQPEHGQIALRVLHQHGDDDVEDQVDPGAVLKELRVAHLQQVVVQVGADQQNQRQADGQPIEVVQAENPPSLIAKEGEVFSAHQECCPAPGERGCSTSDPATAAPGPAGRARRTERNAPLAGWSGEAWGRLSFARNGATARTRRQSVQSRTAGETDPYRFLPD